MIDEKELLSLIRDCIFNGYNEEDIFDRVRSKLQSNHQIGWPRTAYDDLNDRPKNCSYNPVYDQPKQMLQMIRDEMYKARSALKQRRCPSKQECNLAFFSPRYAIHVGQYQNRLLFYLTDLFLEQTRQLHLDGTLTLNGHTNLSIFVLDDNHFIVKAVCLGDDTPCVLYLMELNISNLSYKLLDTKEFPCGYLDIVKDVDCEDRFCLFTRKLNDINVHYLWKCHIEDSKIITDTDRMLVHLDFEAEPLNNSFRIKGNDMHGILLISNGQHRHSFMVTSVKLDEDRASITNQFEVKLFGNGEMLLLSPNFVWCGQKLLVIMVDYYQPTKYLAVEIDLETKSYKFVELKLHIGLDHRCMSEIVEKDGILLVCSTAEKAKRHVNYRVPLSRPDKLKAITITQFRKQSMFMDKKQRNTVMKKLPATLSF